MRSITQGIPTADPSTCPPSSTLASLATRAGVEGGRLRIFAPLAKMSKADIIRRGLALGVDYSLTHSCYDPAPDGTVCGRCDSCRLRAAGFAEAGVADPVIR